MSEQAIRRAKDAYRSPRTTLATPHELGARARRLEGKVAIVTGGDAATTPACPVPLPTPSIDAPSGG